MPLQYRLTQTVREVFARWNHLGFDWDKEVAEAILQHEDWQTRWDLKDADPVDIEAVIDWRNAVWANNRGNIFGQLGDPFKL